MITSTANAHVKFIRSLALNRRERRRERLFVLEGVRLVAEALAARVPLRLVLYAGEQLSATEAGRQVLDQLVDLPNCYPASPQVVAAASDTVTPQGVVAVAPWVQKPSRPGVILLLDEIQDPGNVGTLLRSAEAAGVGQVWCSTGTADLYHPKVVRAAMGAHFSLSLRGDLSWGEMAALLEGVPRVYATVSEACKPYYAADWRHPAALIVGNEAHGISEAALALATEQIAIPMAGRGESLNAAVAGSVILFEMLRQTMAAGGP